VEDTLDAMRYREEVDASVLLNGSFRNDLQCKKLSSAAIPEPGYLKQAVDIYAAAYLTMAFSVAMHKKVLKIQSLDAKEIFTSYFYSCQFFMS
jgi:hypothetical protein